MSTMLHVGAENASEYENLKISPSKPHFCPHNVYIIIQFEILGIFPCNQNPFLSFFLFFMIFPVLSLQKIKKNTSRAQKFFKFFVNVDYIILSISAKNLIKIRRIEFSRGGVTTQTFQCFLLALLQCL